MYMTRPPLLVVGQLYLNEALNEYMIITKNNHGQILYEGFGGQKRRARFKGTMEDQTFIDNFAPVDPADVLAEPGGADELKALLSLCPKGTTAKIGFIPSDEEFDEENDESTP